MKRILASVLAISLLGILAACRLELLTPTPVRGTGETAAPSSRAPTSTPEPTVTLPATPSPRADLPVVTVTALQNLNVRAGPGTGEIVVGVLDTGDQVQTTGHCTDTGWIEISFIWDTGEKGWVHSQYVTEGACARTGDG